MNELDSILSAWSKQPDGGVLATVVRVRGSAYRRPGARMLMLGDGSRLGTISGGCLEGDVCRKAWWLTEDGRPSLRVYDSMSDDDAVWEFGLGCNGVVEVLLERTGMESAGRHLQFLKNAREAGCDCVIAVVLNGSRVGQRLCIRADGLADGELLHTDLAGEVLERAAEMFQSRASALFEAQGTELFLEWVPVPLDLVLFGAGHDALPLATLAEQVGWHVTVADNRPANLQPGRFSRTVRTVLLNGSGPASQAGVRPSSAVVVMTHNYPLDLEVVRDVVPVRPWYLGLLGPRHRTDRILNGIDRASGFEVHAPIGLDIGADSPQMIAVSIVAEIQAALSRRSGQMLRLRKEPIYEPVRELAAFSGEIGPR